jgi:hypothetical protein
LFSFSIPFNFTKLNDQNLNSFIGCSIIQLEVKSKGGVTLELWRLRASTANRLKIGLCWQDYFEKSRL